MNISDVRDGIDFYFAHKQHAAKMISFLQAVSAIRFKTSERLITGDSHTGKGKYKYTYSAEISPVCKVRAAARDSGRAIMRRVALSRARARAL